MKTALTNRNHRRCRHLWHEELVTDNLTGKERRVRACDAEGCFTRQEWNVKQQRWEVIDRHASTSCPASATPARRFGPSSAWFRAKAVADPTAQNSWR